MEFSAIFHDTTTNFISEKEVNALAYYTIQNNIISNENFSGKLCAFELAVLTNL